MSEAPCRGIIRDASACSHGERTVCKVRGVERQPAAQVLVNPPAGLEEIFTLQTEGKKVRFSGLGVMQENRGAHVQACSHYRAEKTGANLTDKKKKIHFQFTEYKKIRVSLGCFFFLSGTFLSSNCLILCVPVPVLHINIKNFPFDDSDTAGFGKADSSNLKRFDSKSSRCISNPHTKTADQRDCTQMYI